MVIISCINGGNVFFLPTIVEKLTNFGENNTIFWYIPIDKGGTPML